MKTTALLITVLFLTIFHPLDALSQNKKIKHSFIIGGKKAFFLDCKLTSEYDPESANHMYVSEFNKKDVLVAKKRFLVIGKNFDLLFYYSNNIGRPENIVVDENGEIAGSSLFFIIGSNAIILINLS